MTGPFDALPMGTRQRLERFAAEFERLDAGEYVLFATVHEEAPVTGPTMAAVGRLRATRQVAVDAAVKPFLEWAAVAYSRRLPATDTFLLYQSLPDRAEDRVRFLGSLERAVVGVVLWDELDADDRDALLGPWLSMAERAAAP